MSGLASASKIFEQATVPDGAGLTAGIKVLGRVSALNIAGQAGVPNVAGLTAGIKVLGRVSALNIAGQAGVPNVAGLTAGLKVLERAAELAYPGMSRHLVLAGTDSRHELDHVVPSDPAGSSVQPVSLTKAQWWFAYFLVCFVVYLVVLNVQLEIEAGDPGVLQTVLEILSVLDLGGQITPVAVGLTAGRLFKRYGPDQPV